MSVVVLQLPMRDSYPCPESKLQTNHSYWSLICFKAAWLKNCNFTEFCEPLWRLAWLTVTDCRYQSLSLAHFAVGRCMPLCSALLDDYSNMSFCWLFPSGLRPCTAPRHGPKFGMDFTMLITMDFQYSVLNTYHHEGCHLKGRAIVWQTACFVWVRDFLLPFFTARIAVAWNSCSGFVLLHWMLDDPLLLELMNLLFWRLLER
jgi:hypothetical protein